MKRAIMLEFDRLAENLSSYSGVFAYRLRNLCVKAEEVSLLPIDVMIEGELQKLEQCTTIGKKDDYSFMIFPNYEEDLEAVGMSITVAHPEFKQKVEKMTLDSVDELGNKKEIDTPYILVTMPEVDDDRYKVLKDGAKLCYDECKSNMEALNHSADANFAELTPGESKEDLEKLKNEREKLNDQWNAQRDSLYKNKLDEIEEAHNKWLATEGQRIKQEEENRAAHDTSVAMSMKMGAEDE